MNPIYLYYPREIVYPGITGWVEAAIASFTEDTPGWSVRQGTYDGQNNFAATALFVRAKNKAGPIILLHPVQAKPLRILREKLGNNVVILDRTVAGPEDIWAAISDAVALTEQGEPMLPRRLVIAVLIVRKLLRQDKWGGTHNYLWARDLPKGGFPAIMTDSVLSVANDLRHHGVLTAKSKNGSNKYALNSDAPEGVHAAAEANFSFNNDLDGILRRDRDLVPATLLEEPFEVEKYALTSTQGVAIECQTVAEAIAHADLDQAAGARKVTVHFNVNRKLWERFNEKAEALAYLRSFLPEDGGQA